jgi:hypothetical protein
MQSLLDRFHHWELEATAGLDDGCYCGESVRSNKQHPQEHQHSRRNERAAEPFFTAETSQYGKGFRLTGTPLRTTIPRLLPRPGMQHAVRELSKHQNERR